MNNCSSISPSRISPSSLMATSPSTSPDNLDDQDMNSLLETDEVVKLIEDQPMAAVASPSPRPLTSSPPTITLSTLAPLLPVKAIVDLSARYLKILSEHYVVKGDFLHFKSTEAPTSVRYASACQALERAFTMVDSQMNAIFIRGVYYRIKEEQFLMKWENRELRMLHITESTEKLGMGTSGAVYCVLDVTKGKYFAVKFAHRNKDKELIEQSKLLREIHSKGIVRGIQLPPEMDIHQPQEVYTNRIIDHLALSVYQLCSGDLSSYCKNNPINIATRIRFVKDVTSAVRNLMALGKFHGDIKPQNIFYLTFTREIYIGDINPRTVSFSNTTGAVQGIIPHTPAYSHEEDYKACFASKSAAELQENERVFDLYSLAATICYILTNEAPFILSAGSSFISSTSQVNSVMNFRLEVNYKDRDNIVVPLKKMLSHHRAERLSAEQVWKAVEGF